MYEITKSIPRILLALIVAVQIGCGSNHPVEKSTVTEPVSTYVMQSNNQLMLNGKSFRFSGANNYYLHYKSDAEILAVLDDAQAMGLQALRIWGFMDGIHHNHSMQPALGQFDIPSGVKSSLERLDFTLLEANKRGLRLVIALTNNWGDFGGIPQYVKWLGADQHDDFYRLPEARAAYKNYARHVITHVNQYTGKAYNQDPTIMTWELANEPRAQSDKSGELLYQWAKEMSDYIRQLAPYQLIALGSEGFFKRENHSDWAYNGNEGVDWERILTLPNINYGTFHLYPEHWGKHNAEEWGTQWIIDHAEAGKQAGKPVVLEEYGIGAAEPFSRPFIYDKWTKTAYEHGVAGTMFWILTSYEPGAPDSLYPDYDGFRVLNDDGLTAEVLKRHARQMQGADLPETNRIYVTYPAEGVLVTDNQFTAIAQIIGDDESVESVLLRTPSGDFDMTDEEGDGYYSTDLMTDEIGFGEQTLIAVATLESGRRITNKVTAKIQRPIVGYERGTYFDFSNGELQGWEKEGTWQAKWKNPALEVSNDLNSPMLKLNMSWSGENDWEELKIRNRRIKDFSQHLKLRYDLYVPVNAGDTGGVRPYAALGDGWVKLNVDKYRQPVAALEKIDINGRQYYKQEVDIDLGDIENKFPDIFLCIVGDKLPMEGSVYLDNIHFLKPVYN